MSQKLYKYPTVQLWTFYNQMLLIQGNIFNGLSCYISHLPFTSFYCFLLLLCARVSLCRFCWFFVFLLSFARKINRKKISHGSWLRCFLAWLLQVYYVDEGGTAAYSYSYIYIYISLRQSSGINKKKNT